MDAALFVLTAHPPVSASERDLMSRVAGLSVSMFVVLSKADCLDAAARNGAAGPLLDGNCSRELAEALDYTAWAAVRRRLPGEVGRCRAREHLRHEAADLAPQLIGRARGDLPHLRGATSQVSLVQK